MTPEPGTKWLSGWALRCELAERGHDASQGQLNQFVEWGLLERVDGRFPPDSVERGLEILEAEVQARPLFRRVLVLRGDFLRFPVLPEQLLRALVQLAPTIRQPMRKLRLVEQVWGLMGSRLSGGRPLGRRALPRANRWPDLLQAAHIETVSTRISGWYAWARDILPLYAKEAKVDLDGIPLEERVLMVAVLDVFGSSPAN